MRNYAALISEELGLTELQVKNTLDLLESGATIPFVARYRKEVTDSMDEVQIAAVRDLHANGWNWTNVAPLFWTPSRSRIN